MTADVCILFWHTIYQTVLLSFLTFNKNMNFNFNFILIQVREYPEVQELLNICKKDGLLNEVDGKLLPVETSNKCKDESIPFVVIEGLDGAGQSFVTIFLKCFNKLN